MSLPETCIHRARFGMATPLLLFGVGFGGAHGDIGIPTLEIASNVHMPVISIGTGGLERSDAKTIAENWLSLGGVGIDTAWLYHDQDVVAEAIAEMKVSREKLFITTKIPGCTGAQTSSFVEQDLQLLGVEYIDLLLIHAPVPMLACAETWGVLEDYHAKGVLKAIGISNFNSAQMQAVLQTAEVVPAVNQIQLNVLMHDDATTAFCQAHNIVVEAYSPLGRGGHSGDIPDNEVIKTIAVGHNVTAYQVAMKWILQHGYIVTFQSVSAEHQRVDADVFGFDLTAQDMAELDGLQGAQAEQLITV